MDQDKVNALTDRLQNTVGEFYGADDGMVDKDHINEIISAHFSAIGRLIMACHPGEEQEALKLAREFLDEQLNGIAEMIGVGGVKN